MMASGHTGTPPDTGALANAAGADEVQALLRDIFALTGQKVQLEDPLVAAALIHSSLLRRAGQDAAQAVQEAAQRAIEDLERCLQRQAASELNPAHQPSPARHQPSSTCQPSSGCATSGGPALVLPCLLAGALGAAIALAATRRRG